MKQFKFEELNKTALVKNLCGESTSVVINDFVTALLQFQKVPVYELDSDNNMKVCYPWTVGTLKDFMDTYLNKDNGKKYFLLAAEYSETPDVIVSLWNKAVSEDRASKKVSGPYTYIFEITEPKVTKPVEPKQEKSNSSLYIKRVDNGKVTFERTCTDQEKFYLLLLEYIDMCYGGELRTIAELLTHFNI